MAVGQDKQRINLTISKELKAQVEAKAKEQERSTNSMIILLVKRALEHGLDK